MVELRAFSLKLFADLVKCLMVTDRQDAKMVKNLKWINGKHEFRLKYRKYESIDLEEPPPKYFCM